MSTYEEPIKQGWLLKKSRYIGDWRRRWVVLTRSTICAYKNKGAYEKPTEIIFMNECNTVKSAEDDVHKENSFRVDAKDRIFYFVAEHAQDKESWIGHIGRQMVRPTVMTEYDDNFEQS
eukprot:Selendium_serpulae@DN4726_c0_g1_i3.p1